MPNARRLLDEATARLDAAGVPSPRVDAEILLAHVTGRQRTLLALLDPAVDEGEQEKYAALVSERSKRIPLQHLTGRAPFRHLDVAVGPGVFVPRPETEGMVDAAVAFLGSADEAARRRTSASRGSAAGSRPPVRTRTPVRTEDTVRPRDPSPSPAHSLVVDLCAGSMAIALSLAIEVPGVDVVAVEVDQRALEWGQRNLGSAQEMILAAGSSVELIGADAGTVAEPGGALRHLESSVALVISNPPYVPDGMVPREPEVRDHDPDRALYGGQDGLAVIRRLVAQAEVLLRAGGMLLVEHADVQGEDAPDGGVPGLLRERKAQTTTRGSARRWTEVADHLDLTGRPRFTSALRAEDHAG